MEELTGLETRLYQSQCLSEDNVNKLENNGYTMIDTILFSDVYQIHRKTGITMETIFSIQTNLQKMFSSVPINGYQHLLNDKEFKECYSTGIELLDQLLVNDNGFKSGEIYELVGPTSCGKTQISMVCSLNLSSQYSGNVIYIDSSNSFSSNRLVEIYKTNYYLNNNNDVNVEDDMAQDNLLKILDRIKVYNCFEPIILMDLLNLIDNHLFEERSHNEFYKDLKMIVIDSIGTLLSPIIGGKQTQGHYMMMAISRIIKTIADKHQIVFLITNNTVSSGNSDNSNNKAALGEAWSMVPNHQLMINHYYSDDENEERSIYIEKSTRLPKKRVIKSFKISDNGVTH